MKKLIVFLFLSVFSCISLNAQDLSYFPKQRDAVSNSDYQAGIDILKTTYQSIKENKGKVSYAHYWNLAVAYTVLKEPNIDFVRNFLQECKKQSPKEFSFYIIQAKSANKTPFKGYLSRDEFDKMYKEALEVAKQDKTKELVILPKNKIKGSISVILTELDKRDQKYREYGNIDDAKQRILDKENMQIIDSLYNQVGSYIGTSIAGENLNHVMWLIIQHNGLEVLTKYLPVLRTAVLNKELPSSCYKMSVDRVLCFQKGYQLYGSQIGMPLAPDNKLDSLINLYDLDKKK